MVDGAMVVVVMIEMMVDDQLYHCHSSVMLYFHALSTMHQTLVATSNVIVLTLVDHVQSLLSILLIHETSHDTLSSRIPSVVEYVALLYQLLLLSYRHYHQHHC